MIFFWKFKIAVAQKLLGIFKIRLQIRILRTRFSLKRKCLVIEMPKIVRKFRKTKKIYYGFFFYWNSEFFYLANIAQTNPQNPSPDPN